MKFIHLSDLHLGKRVHAFSMLEEQAHILREIRRIIACERPDGVLIAGDIYDKPVPPAEAVQLFDDFLSALAADDVPVFVISGNHDSPERIAFGNRLMAPSGIHLSPVYDGTVAPVTLTDAHGAVNLYLLPFLKPAVVRHFYPDADIVSYTDALRTAITHLDLDPRQRNVLLAHQFVTGASRSESEEISVGGTDNVDAEVFSPFDYVALGHLHNPQNLEGGRVRYCGTPLAYSFSEAKHEKSVTVVELGGKGDCAVRTVALHPRRPLRALRGTYAELTRKSFYDGTTYPADYLHITLTDEEDVPEALAKLRVIYPFLMRLEYDNRRTRAGMSLLGTQAVENRSPLALFAEFYEKQNNAPLSEEQHACVSALIESIWEGAQ